MPNDQSQIGKIVWLSCRGHPDCEGKQSKILLIRKVSGSRHIRYRCMTCKRLFTIVL